MVFGLKTVNLRSHNCPKKFCFKLAGLGGVHCIFFPFLSPPPLLPLSPLQLSSTVTSLSGSLLHLVGVAASLEEQEKLHGKVTETQQLLDDILKDIKEIDKEVCP